MGVLVQFKIDGIDEARNQLNAFNKDLKELSGTADQASKSGLASISKSLDDVGKRLQSVGKNMISFGKSASIGLTVPIVAAGAALISFASDAVESENLFKIAMGDMEKDARDFSVTMRRELGLNEFEIRKQIGTLFQMTSSMGLSKDAAYSMATGLTTLTHDMASFFNLKPEEAFQKLQAGITGEVEPLKRLGIIVNETTVRQAALNAGLIQGSEVMTEQQKVMARYITILEQTKNAQGDLARTIDSPTNQMRLLTAEFKQQSIELGMALLPLFQKFLTDAVKPAVEWFGRMVTGFKQLKPELQSIIVGFAGFLAVLGPLAIGLGVFIKSIGIIMGASGLAGLLKLLSGGTAVAALATLGGIAASTAAVGAAFLAGYAAASLFKNAITEFGRGADGIIQGVKDDFQSLADTLSIPFTKIKSEVADLFKVDGSNRELESQFTNFSETVQRSMQQSSAAISQSFEQTNKVIDKTELNAINMQQELAKRDRERANLNREVNESINELQEHFANQEIDRIERIHELDVRAQYDALIATRERFRAMGEDGVAAVNAIDAKMRELEIQITDRTFGGGAKRALQEYIDQASNLGKVAEDVIGTAFMNLEQVVSNFIQTGKLSFGDFVDSMKKALADFLASQIVKTFVKFLMDVWNSIQGGSGILASITSAASGIFSAGTAAAAGTAAGGAAAGAAGGAAAGGAAGGLAGLAGAAQTLAINAGAGLAGYGVARLLGLGEGTTGAVGGTVGTIAGAFIGGPIGAAIGSFIGSTIGGFFHDEDYPYANAKIVVGPGGASLSKVTELDNGPVSEVTALANAVVTQFNDIIRELGISDPGSYSLSLGFVKPGRPGALEGPFFAGIPGDFAGGATFEGLSDAQAAASAAIDFMSGKSANVREALLAQGFNVPAYATGGTGIFTQPTMIMVGERPERVTVGHLSHGNSGAGGVQIILQGPNIIDDISSSKFARQISRTIQKQINRGIS